MVVRTNGKKIAVTTKRQFTSLINSVVGQHISIVNTLPSGIEHVRFITVGADAHLTDTYNGQVISPSDFGFCGGNDED